METILRGIPGVSVYLDDILIAGGSEDENVERLQRVLSRLKGEKCVFFGKICRVSGVCNRGRGFTPTSRRGQSDTRSSYIPKCYGAQVVFGTVVVLFEVSSELGNAVKWKWSVEQENAFKTAKKLLESLVQFNPELEIQVACDASAYVIGAVLSHRFPDGSEKPIVFMSHTLNEAEKNYCQSEKEGLACVVGVTQFHSYFVWTSLYPTDRSQALDDVVQ